MRILAIGDIHGCSNAFETLLTLIDLKQDDTLVTLGDYVDRGPDSRLVLDRLVGLAGKCHHIPLRGNHDQMMMCARHDSNARYEWEWVGGRETLRSYGGRLSGVPDSHWHFLDETCLNYWECDTHFFVHGNVYPDRPLSKQPAHQLYWARFENVQPHISGKIMVCGHTSQKDGLPKNLGFAVCIDTWAHAGQWLTCLDIHSGTIYQANIDSETRGLQLDELHKA